MNIRLEILNISTMKKIDSQKIFKIYDDWPKIAEKSFKLDIETEDFKNINHIVFAGMGGSGTIGDIFESILSKKKIHVNVVKGYLLPKTVDRNTLVVIVSVSGNSAETLAILKSSKKLGSKIIAFCSGGKMEKYCNENKIKYKIIPKFHSPRATLPSYLYSILKVLHKTLEIKEDDIYESIKEIEKLNKKINSLNLKNENPSLNLANWIKKIPVIYYPLGLKSVAIRFKNSLQENSKIHVLTENVIEASHNGIVSWSEKADVIPILIRGFDDQETTKQRWGILKEYFEYKNIEYQEIISKEGNILTKIICMIYLLDYSSIFLAINRGIDPTPVDAIDFVKNKLESK
jgi:glucose/mannose-6-phosphate isomerase